MTAAQTQGAPTRSPSRYRRLYAIARSLGLDNEALHEFILTETGRESLKLLTDPELEAVCRELDRRLNGSGPSRPSPRRGGPRTDEGGNPRTSRQRARMYKLAQTLGWDEKRVDAFCLSEYGVSSQKWLTPAQCSDCIEALKAMVKRGGAP